VRLSFYRIEPRPDPVLRRLGEYLGGITQVTVRLYGIPAAISAVVCSFASIEAAKIDFVVAEHGERR
jgi:FAD/FMN-containing dehydrogenase